MHKSIWDCSITVHLSFKEDMNSVLLSLAKDKEIQKKKVVQDLLDTHPEYIKKKEEMKKAGFFI